MTNNFDFQKKKKKSFYLTVSFVFFPYVFFIIVMFLSYNKFLAAKTCIFPHFFFLVILHNWKKLVIYNHD